MSNIRLVNYEVKGIKSLDEDVVLSFYKKTISSKAEDFQKYNIKGIYGINGSGKTAIITSILILKNIITNRDYLNNPIIQSQLNAHINSKLQRMDFSVEFYVNFDNKPSLFCYKVSLAKDKGNKIVIDREILSTRSASGRKENAKVLFEINSGEIKYIDSKDHEYVAFLVDKTLNLLKTSALPSLFFDLIGDKKYKRSYIDYPLSEGLVFLLFLGLIIFVHLDSADDHFSYFLDGALLEPSQFMDDDTDEDPLRILEAIEDIKKTRIKEITASRMVVPKKQYSKFKSRVARLYDFIYIFKKDLKDIIIDKRDDKSNYICDLIMDYGQYKINAEFESTGIKKLIGLYEFFDAMKTGSIVFIDELDSNLHDVYLCALLEYLMEYGEGQLCFTSHNIGPMNILKKNQKSIDFLSENHKIYSWTKNGNYQPERLYRSGMIEGSPFNIDSTDFISAFANEEGEK